MGQLTILSDNTPQGGEALQLHFEIKASLEAAASAITEFARLLKRMRDKKLYEHIGFESFESYVEKAHNIKQRQAYTYIQTYEKLQPKLMSENSQLGITKLSLLCQISAPEREEFAEENDLAGLTVEELKKLIEEKNGLYDQVELLQLEKSDNSDLLKTYDGEVERLKSQLAEKNETIEKLSTQQKPIDVAAVEKEKIDAAVQVALKEAEKERAATVDAAIKAAVKKEKEESTKTLIEKVAAEKADTIKEVEARLKKEFEEKISSLSGETIFAREQAEKLEKQLSLAGNKSTVKFSILFEQVQQDIIACTELLEEIKQEDEKTADKLLNALKSVLRQIVE